MVNEQPPPSELTSALRNQAFAEIVQTATLAVSYSHSLAEAAYRGDQLTVEVHLRQLRLCTLLMIKTFKSLEGDSG